MDSIWKDIFVDFGAVASVNYNVEVTGYGEVFRGTAYARPGAASCVIRINDIVADAFGMLQTLPWAAFSAVTFPMEVVVNDLDTTTEVYRENVVMNWSYDYDVEDGGIANTFLSDPITGELLNGQYFMYNGVPSSAPLTIDIYETDSDGVTTPETFDTDLAWLTYFDDSEFLRRLKSAGSGTIVVDTTEFSYDPVKIEVDGWRYDMVACGRFVLYYLNAFGGWDSLIVHEGTLVQEDGVTRHTVGVDYNNGDPTQAGRLNYANELQRHFTMHTGWLTDAQASRMHHLLNSPCVYLHDIIATRIVPLVLTNTTTQYKTYQNQGLRMVDYTITAELGVDMMRQ